MRWQWFSISFSHLFLAKYFLVTEKELAEKIFCLFWKLTIWIWRWNKSKTKSSSFGNSMIYEFANLQSIFKLFWMIVHILLYFLIIQLNSVTNMSQCIVVIRTFISILLCLKFIKTFLSWLHYSSWSKWLHWLPKLENLKKNFR